MIRVIASVSIVLALMASACATKKYVRTQTGVVNDRVSQIQAQTNEQIASLSTKEQTDVSRLDERITTTNNLLAATTKTAEEARGSAAQANTAASQAMQQAQANSTQISATSSNITKVQADLAAQAKALDYTLSETGNVTFRFDQSDLTDEAKAALGPMIQKATATPRSILEVVGFADSTGSQPYNTVLSQKRAESVARYLVHENVPLKGIALIGLGEEQSPEQLAAEVQGFDPNASPAQMRAFARRVRIRLYVPATATSSAAAGASAETGTTAAAKTR